MQQFVIASVCVLNLFISVSYIWLLRQKRIQPALAMWVFFTLAVSMSLITYIKEGPFGFWDNALNTTDLFLVVSVVVGILLYGDKSMHFNKFDLLCLGAVSMVIVFWFFTQNHFIANLSIQIIMVLAYFPVVRRMLKSKKNTEPFVVWAAMMIVPLVSMLSSKGLLASVYAIRASICTALLLTLMLRIELKNRKGQRTPETNSLP